MLKIGIMTLVGSDNCGSLLQAYALQTYLEQHFDCKVTIINYRDDVSLHTYGIFAPAILVRPVQLLRTLQHYKRLKRQQYDYEQFRKKELHLTHKIYHTLQELQAQKWNYDILVSGSDQVWNWPEAYIDESYFLDWGGNNVRRIAYAPSTGGSINPENSLLEWVNGDTAILKKIRKCLAKFQMISVREESGQIYLQRLLDTEIPLVADPTLMLNPNSWIKLAANSIVKGEYIFYYSYGYKNDELNLLVKKAAKKLQLPVYVINASLWNHRNNKKLGFIIHPEGGPYAYLSLMKHAKYVFAESFHGCIFAFIFHKNFWFMNNYSDGRMEARIYSLLNYLQLTNRSLHSVNFESTDLAFPIDYDKPFLQLEKLCEQSADYLNVAINTNKSLDYNNDSLEYQIAQKVQWTTMPSSEIKRNFMLLKPKALLLKNRISDIAFQQYFYITKSELDHLSGETFQKSILKNPAYIEQHTHQNLIQKYGYLGHLVFRLVKKFHEGGIKSVLRSIVVKYKWWFRIGY